MKHIDLYRRYQSSHPCHSEARIFSPGDSRYFEKNFEPILPVNKKARILDIGCGAGYFLQYVRSLGYAYFLGIDLSKEQIDFCKKKHLGQHVALITDVKKFLSGKKLAFDFIMMNDVIEHIPKDDIIDVLSLVYASLSRGGRLVVKTANLKHRWGMAVRYMDFTHTTGFTEESLRQVLYLSGFRNVIFVSESHPIHDIQSFLRVTLKYMLELIYRAEYAVSFGDFGSDVRNMLIAVSDKKLV